MKKDYRDSTLFNLDNLKKIDSNTIKTTNVNVLLNRVRLDQKRTLKKRILFSTSIALLVSLIAIFFII